MNPLPDYLTKHHVAQDAGQFRPDYRTTTTTTTTTTTMNPIITTTTMNPIITNARLNRPISSANRRRKSSVALILITSTAFWIGVAVLAAIVAR
jgi:hypothetical protein